MAAGAGGSAGKVALADHTGVDGVSTRSLAHEPGVVPMALGKHMATKEELLDGMVDVVVSEIEPPADDTDWKSAIRGASLLRYGPYCATRSGHLTGRLLTEPRCHHRSLSPRGPRLGQRRPQRRRWHACVSQPPLAWPCSTATCSLPLLDCLPTPAPPARSPTAPSSGDATEEGAGTPLLLPLCVLRAGAPPATGPHRFDHLRELLGKLGHGVLELVSGNGLT